MAIFFSPSTSGFHDDRLGAIPRDAHKISPHRHRELMKGQAIGKRIVAGRDGQPVLVDRIEQSAETIRAGLIAGVRREAARRIEAISPQWRQLNDLREPSEPGAERFARIDSIRAASALIEATADQAPAEALAAFPIRENLLWPEFAP